MLRALFIAVLVVCLSASGAVPVNCTAGVPLGDIRLKVQSDPKLKTLPFRAINRLEEGDTILYSPVKLRVNPKGGKVALVVAPAPVKPGDPVPKELPKLEVLSPLSADKPGEWKVPFRVGVAALVYGPEGMNVKRVKEFLTKEDDLIAQMADYAEKTAQTEALMAAITAGAPLNSTQMDAALNGFSSQYGIAGSIDRTLPRDQQLSAMMRAVNPALGTVDPVAPDASARYQQTAILAASVAGAFFGNTIGLAAGGTALFMNLRAMMFPGTEFRSSFAISTQAPADDLDLCGKREPPKPRTKIAYLWASRVPNAGPPVVKIGTADYVPVESKGGLAVSMDDAAWKVVDRARDWVLTDANTKKEFPVKVHSVLAQKALEIDLSGSKIEAGTYQLKAAWDWNTFLVSGDVHVAPLANFQTARLTPESQDQLREEKGKTVVQAEGADFEFVEKVAVIKTGDKYSQPANLPFSLPEGKGQGPQGRLEFEMDTKPLSAGAYSLILTQVDGKEHIVPILLLPLQGPKIESSPLSVNVGGGWQGITLRGANLDQLSRLEAKSAKFELGPVRGNERDIKVQLSADAKAGDVTDLLVFAQNVSKPVILQGAFQVAGPAPKILDSQIAVPPQNNIPLKAGELPAGGLVSASLHVKNAGSDTAIHLNCAKSHAQELTFRTGEQTPRGSMQSLGSDSLFVSFDPGTWQAGCEVTAVLDNGLGGQSKAFTLGRVIRMPRVDAFALTDEKAGENYVGQLTGTDLETIAQVSWTGDHGVPVTDLPTPLGGDSRKQTLRISLPWPPPSPKAPLYIWFRGETEGRVTRIQY